MRSLLNGPASQFIEMLERRQCLSASAATTGITPTGLSAAPVFRVALLGPSAVEGNYKGDVQGNDGVIYEVKMVVTATSAKLTVVGLGTYTSALSTRQFKKIRQGTFSVDFTDSKGGVTLTGTVKDSGLKISGTYVNTLGKTGVFILKKY